MTRSPDAVLIAAMSPDDWIPIALGSGITATSGAYVPAGRQHGDQVELSGTVNGTISTGTALGTLDASLWPNATVRISTANASGISVTLNISTSGVILAELSGSVTAVTFDSLSFRRV